MCVLVRERAMGCGKSKHRSREDSDIDNNKHTKNSNHGNNSSAKNGGGGNNNGGGGNSATSAKKDNNTKESSTSSSSSSSSSSTSSSWNSGSKKKKHHNDNKTSQKDNDKEEKTSSPFKLLSNGKSSNRGAQGGRSEEVGVPAGLSASGKTNGNGSGTGDKSNGALSSNKSFALEVPNEISKPESHQKTTCRDFKSLTSSKTVHVTSSQIEFFKMLDDMIEKGDEYTTSNDVSEVSSLDDNTRH